MLLRLCHAQTAYAGNVTPEQKRHRLLVCAIFLSGVAIGLVADAFLSSNPTVALGEAVLACLCLAFAWMAVRKRG